MRIMSNLLFGLMVCLSLLLLLEGIALIIPKSLFIARPDQGLVRADLDRGIRILKANGYRGKRPCISCPESNTRIVTIGGSSTFGIPMISGEKTYSAYLERLLNERVPGKHYEVLNGGVPGFGIWQIVEALEHKVLADNPNIVILSAWFNDSSYGPGWYGFKELSDYEGYKKVNRLRAIERNFLYKVLNKSRAYAMLRQALLSLMANQASETNAKNKRFRRSTPQEFKLGVERVIELSKSHHFKLVFLFEPLNRTLDREKSVKKNRYYQALEELSRAHKITLVDSLTPLAMREGEWLFYDFIHPNEHGHAVIAEALYQHILD